MGVLSRLTFEEIRYADEAISAHNFQCQTTIIAPWR